MNILVVMCKCHFKKNCVVLNLSPPSSKTLGNLALICRKWCLNLLLSHVCGTRAVQKGAKKALLLICTNNKAKKKGAQNEHLNYHSLSFVIIDYHNLFSDANNECH